jgi:nickel-dependent lactate racemase
VFGNEKEYNDKVKKMLIAVIFNKTFHNIIDSAWDETKSIFSLLREIVRGFSIISSVKSHPYLANKDDRVMALQHSKWLLPADF